MLESFYKDQHTDKICYQESIATLNMDKGIDNIEIKMFKPNKEYWEFKLEDFVDILEKAKKLLIEINEEPEE